MSYQKYLDSINNMNKIAKSVNEDELNRISESDIFWAKNKNDTFINRTIKKGNIYQFEFGKNFIPEMSYEHRGLVIGKSNKLLYVLPIYTYDNLKHKNCYHPIDNPHSKSDFFLLKKQEFRFLKKDSVLKLNDIRTVSIKRIKYSYNYRININSNTFKNIEKMVFIKYFPNIAFEYNKIIEENQELKEQIKNLTINQNINTNDNQN